MDPLTIENRIKRIRPLFPEGSLDNLKSKSMIRLCEIGKEIAREIFERTIDLVKWKQLPPEMRVQKQIDFEAITIYCVRLMAKLIETCLIVDSKLDESRLSADDYVRFAMVSEDNREDETSEAKIKYAETFKRMIETRSRVVIRDGEMKKQEWLDQVSCNL